MIAAGATCYEEGMPRERAWHVAVKLSGEGRSETEIRATLLRLGFELEEAQLAVGALADGQLPNDREVRELHARTNRDAGYYDFLWAAVLLGGGVLVAMASKGVFGSLGALAAAGGGALLVRGAWRSWRGAQ
jgi:hypothetical protein